MSITTKHQCPSCGGYLIIDNDKQLYRCVSCGSTYDFDYFREEKLLELGDTALSRGEFDAAVDVFKLILQNDPHDFQANRGMMLAAARLSSKLHIFFGIISVLAKFFLRYCVATICKLSPNRWH